MAKETPSETRILRLPEVLARVGLRRSTVYQLMDTGEFPASVRLTPNAVGWRSDDIDDWVASRVRTCSSRPAQMPTPFG